MFTYLIKLIESNQVSDTVIAIYAVGGLIAVGIVLGEAVSEMKEGISNSYGFFDTIFTVLFLVAQLSIFCLIAFLFSWISVGFLYQIDKR